MSDHTTQKRFWLIALIALLVVLWALKPMLLPFVVGMAIAYFLNPPVNALSRLGLPRWLGTLTALLGFALVVVLMLLLIVPLLQSQIGALLQALPAYIQTLRDHIQPWAEQWMAKLSPDDVEKLRTAAGEYAGSVVGWSAKLVQGVISNSLALFDILTLLIITPVVAFYLLRDWPKLTRTLDKLLPRKQYALIRAELAEIDRTLSGFVRGQALVCLALGLIYGIGLSLVGLKYGATIGIIAGFLSFIPYVGSTFGWVASLALGFTQFDDHLHLGLIIGIFAIGQILEGYVLTPKLVGDRVGLHPVWILFALFAGGSLMGFVGVLIAVPVAAVIGVLTRFALRHYRASSFYGDTVPPAP